MRAEILESVLDFLYRGEVNIYQENLNDFLAAEELELKGLTGHLKKRTRRKLPSKKNPQK